MQVTHSLPFPREDITTVCSHGDRIISGSSSGILRLHSTDSAALLLSLRLPRATAVSCLTAIPATDAADACISAASYNKVHSYSLRYGNVLGEFEAHADLVNDMSWSGASPGQFIMYTASHDTTVKAWPMSSHRFPWQSGAPPLFELDTADNSVPLCVEV